MDTKVVSEKDYNPVSRGPRGSRYDGLVEKLGKLGKGKFLSVSPEKGETVQELRGRLYSGISNVLRRRDEEMTYSCTIQQDGTVAIRKRT